MDKKKSLDLIKLEVLGCLTDKDKDNLKGMKADENEFPWKELGDYQNLIAFLPMTLELKYPASELKDKTAMKLYSIRDQIKAKIDAKKAKELPPEPIEEISVSEQEEEIEIQEDLEENIITEQIEVEEKVFAEVEAGINLKEDNSVTGKDESFRFVNKSKEKSDQEIFLRKPDEIEVKEPPKAVVDKELIEKIARDYVKSHLAREIETLRKTVDKNKLLSFILFAVSVVLIIAMYFIS